MEGAHWRYLPMCCSSVARLHHRLFKPPSRCGAMSLTAVTLPPLWFLTGSRDVATAKLISTHTYIHVYANMSTHTEYPILTVASSYDLYSWDLFLFTQTLTMCKLELVPHWRESACHISIVVFCFLGGFGEVGLRNFLVVVVQFVSQATFSHRSSIAVIPNQRCSCLRLLHGRLWRSSTNLEK